MEALVVLAIPALVKLVELVNHKDWDSASKIILASAAGLAAGYFGVADLNLVSGLSAGLSASGIVTVAGYAGKKASELTVEAKP